MRWLVKIIISWLLVWGSWESWIISHRRFAWPRNWRWDHQWVLSIRTLDLRWVEINRSIWSLPPSWYWNVDPSWPFDRSDTRSARASRVDGPPSTHRNFCDRWTCNWGWSRLAWVSIAAHLSLPRGRCLLSKSRGKYFHLLFVGVALLGCLERVSLFHLFFSLFRHVSYNYYQGKNREIVKSGGRIFLGLGLGFFWRKQGNSRVFITANSDMWQLLCICVKCSLFGSLEQARENQ